MNRVLFRSLVMPAAFIAILAVTPMGWFCPLPASAAEEELKVEVVKKGLGKEVVIRKGALEWFMMIEVTPENTVIVRQEKQNETYLVDESETHDRSMTPGEVDAAIESFIDSVKARVKKGK